MRQINLLAIIMILSLKCNYAQEIIYYDDFQYNINSGFSSFILNNEKKNHKKNMIKRVGAIPSEEELVYRRPIQVIGDRDDNRKQTAINLYGNNNKENYEGESWVVMDPVDISPYKDIRVMFATRLRFHEGVENKSGLKILIAKNYKKGQAEAEWIDVTSEIENLKNVLGEDGKWAVSELNVSSYTDDIGANKFVVAFNYKYYDKGKYSTSNNRNGTWSISDVMYINYGEDH